MQEEQRINVHTQPAVKNRKLQLWFPNNFVLLIAATVLPRTKLDRTVFTAIKLDTL